MISLGGGFQNYITQKKDGSPRMNEIRAMKEVAEFVRPREKYCFRGKAKHQVAILLSAWDRKHESVSLFSRTGYERVLGTTALLCDAGHSTEIVSEHTIRGKCADYPVLLVPELHKGLAKETIVELMDYAKNGGNLFLMGQTTCKVFAENGAPFCVNDVEKDEYRFFTMDNASFGAVLGMCGVQAEASEWHAVSFNKQSADEQNLVEVGPFGKGKIAAVGSDIGMTYMKRTQYLYRVLVRAILDRMYDPIVRIESVEGKLEVTVLEKDGRTMIQLVNGNGDHANPLSATEDFIPACYNAKLAIKLPKKPAKLIQQPCGKELDFVYADGKAYVTIDKIPMHEIIEVQE